MPMTGRVQQVSILMPLRAFQVLTNCRLLVDVAEILQGCMIKVAQSSRALQ